MDNERKTPYTLWLLLEETGFARNGVIDEARHSKNKNVLPADSRGSA